MRAPALALALLWPAMAQGTCAADAVLVFDGSASMAEIGFDIQDAPRIVDARKAVARALPLVEGFRRIGLITYGPEGADACSGIDLRLQPQARAAAAIVAEIDALRPAGLTPLAAAVAQAAETLSYRTDPAIVVLVTDGNETCGGRPCALSDRLMADARDLTIHVIGFKATRDVFAWDNPEQHAVAGDTVAKCLSDRSGGLFVDAQTVDDLVDALQATLGCPLIGAATSSRPGPA